MCCGQGAPRGIGHFGDYVPGGPSQYMKVTGAVQGNQAVMTPAFLPGGQRQYMKVTGATQSTPNETGGMHVQYAGARNVSGLSDLIPGIPDMYLWIFGGVLAVILISRG